MLHLVLARAVAVVESCSESRLPDVYNSDVFALGVPHHDRAGELTLKQEYY